MEKVSQNIYQIYEKSKDTKSLMQNLKHNSFYIGDFLEQYEFVKEIGKGGHDNIVVKQYTEKNGNRIYAVKSYSYYIQQDKSDLFEFINEIYTQEKIQNKIDCAYINNMKGFFMEQDDDIIYLNMILEYQDGNLDQLIKYYLKNKTQKLDFSKLIKIFQQQLTVLKICEENLITHRDVKPTNIVYRKDLKYYISQLAYFGEASKNENLIQTRNTSIRGSPQYLSPELLYAYIKKLVDVDKYNPYKSDTYSLGLSILSLASSNNYFKRNTENMLDPLKYNQQDIGQEGWEYVKSINVMFEQFQQKYQKQSNQDKNSFVDIIKMCLCYNPKYRNTSSEILKQLNIKFYDTNPEKIKQQQKIQDNHIQLNKKHCETQQYLNGDKYEGNWKDFKQHGQGTYYYQNGSKYVGNWEDGYYHGQGTEYYQNGGKYVGGFKYGKKHGQGTYYYQNDVKYVGKWQNGNKHGQGTEYYQNGDKYEGEYKGHQRHGQGTYYYQNGNKAYEGDWKYGYYHGQGTEYYQNGEKYQGEFKDNKKHGQGTYYYQDGKVEQQQYQQGQLV